MGLAVRSGMEVTVVATATPGDVEMADRIAAHRSERPAGWAVVEEPLRLPEAVRAVADDRYVIIDCLTLWVNNLMESGASIVSEATDAAEALSRRSGVVVTNEVGSGIVPVNELARRYRDRLGQVNSVFAEHAEEAFLVVAGRGLRLEAI